MNVLKLDQILIVQYHLHFRNWIVSSFKLKLRIFAKILPQKYLLRYHFPNNSIYSQNRKKKPILATLCSTVRFVRSSRSVGIRKFFQSGFARVQSRLVFNAVKNFRIKQSWSVVNYLQYYFWLIFYRKKV